MFIKDKSVESIPNLLFRRVLFHENISLNLQDQHLIDCKGDAVN